jgi:hypothetical protein
MFQDAFLRLSDEEFAVRRVSLVLILEDQEGG